MPEPLATAATAPRVAFIGIGAMGGPMAARLCDAGFAVRGFDRDAAALARLAGHGGQACAALTDAVAKARVVVLMVHDEQQVDAILFGDDGIVARLAPDTTIWLASTVTPAFVRRIAARLDDLRIGIVDGPVSGGVTGAESGMLTVIAAGRQPALDAVEPVMRACAEQIFRVGDIGAASTVKMINQMLVASHLALTAEAIGFALQAGVDPRQLVDVVTHSSGTSRMFEKRAPRMIDGDHTKQSTVRIFLKDLAIALEGAHALGYAAPVTEAARQVFRRAADAGHLDDSDTRLLDVYRTPSRTNA